MRVCPVLPGCGDPRCHDPAHLTQRTQPLVVRALMPMAYGVPSDELLVGRARVTRLPEQGLAFARVGAGSKHAC